ncbi:MAG: VWA domain-containing protein [Thermoanaerobaculum sp.]
MAIEPVVQPFAPLVAEERRDLTLSLQELTLTGKVTPVGAHLWVRHVFRSAESRPCEVVYAFALPRDAALRQFRVLGESFAVTSQLRPVEEARQLYEDGLARGHLATLAQEYQDGVVNLSVGNLRPGETVVVLLEVVAGVDLTDHGFRLRFPFTMAPTYHPDMRAVEVAPGVLEMELPEKFGDVLLPPWWRDASELHGIGFSLEVWAPHDGLAVASPSHHLRVQGAGKGSCRVSLAVGRDVPNRDLILDGQSDKPWEGFFGGPEGSGGGHFAFVLPSTTFGQKSGKARNVVFVLDRSGSMGGQAIAQARRALLACLSVLNPEDNFAIVAFDNTVETFTPTLVPADEKHRKEARGFLAGVEARGGTELAAGLETAAQMLGEEGGDILVITDGQVSDTAAIIARAKDLGVRVHCLGIGSASQDRFLALLARETHGLGRFLGPRENVETEALELFASLGGVVARDLKVSGDGVEVSPEPPKTVFSGRPLVLWGERQDDVASVTLRWRSEQGNEERAWPVVLVHPELAETVKLLRGARLITDFEASLDDEEMPPAGKKREQDRALQQLSQKFGLASQAMALVAVVKRSGDRPGELPTTSVVPVGMPEGVQWGAYSGRYRFRWEEPFKFRKVRPSLAAIHHGEKPESRLLTTLAGLLDADGGLPGPDLETRWLMTASAVAVFLGLGETPHEGPYRLHVQRMLAFLKSFSHLLAEESLARILAMLEKGTLPIRDREFWFDWGARVERAATRFREVDEKSLSDEESTSLRSLGKNMRWQALHWLTPLAEEVSGAS